MRQDFWIAAAAALFLSGALMTRSHERRAYGRSSAVWLVLVAALEGLRTLLPGIGMAEASDITGVIASITLGVVLIRLLGYSLFRVLLPAVGAAPPRILGDLAVTAAILLWCFVWLHRSGLDFSSLVATSAVVTGITVFSMQETIGNIMGGLALQADDSIRVGDWVKVDDVNGRVAEVRWRFTAIETNNRETVVVPNSYLVKNRFTVIGRRSDADIRWRRWVWYNITLDSSPMHVCQVLERAVHNAEIPNVAREPAASAVLMDFVPGAGRYALRYWLIEPKDEDPTSSLVRAHCLAALQRHGMRLALPVEEQLVIQQDQGRRKAEEALERDRRVAALRNVDLFAALTAEELHRLSSHLVPAPFLAGAVMTRQGDEAHWLYIMIEGEAEVWIEAPGRGSRQVATVKGGDVFGEMSLLTGASRSASVIARTDVTCYRLDKEGFSELLHARQDFAEELTRVMTGRDAELRREQGQLNDSMPFPPETLLRRIRSFFGLQ